MTPPPKAEWIGQRASASRRRFWGGVSADAEQIRQILGLLYPLVLGKSSVNSEPGYELASYRHAVLRQIQISVTLTGREREIAPRCDGKFEAVIRWYGYLDLSNSAYKGRPGVQRAYRAIAELWAPLDREGEYLGWGGPRRLSSHWRGYQYAIQALCTRGRSSCNSYRTLDMVRRPARDWAPAVRRRHRRS
jgi:hypothetical protein